MKNLELYGVQELNVNEKNELNGGRLDIGTFLGGHNIMKFTLGFLAGLGDGLSEGLDA